MPGTRWTWTDTKNAVVATFAIVLLPVGAFVVLALVPLLALGLHTHCDENRLDLPSPNGRWIASKVDQACSTFLDGAFSTRISVRQDASWAPWIKIFETGGDPDTEMKWVREGILDITVQDGSTPSLSAHHAAGVHVRYHVGHRSPVSDSPFYERFRRWEMENVEEGRPK